MPKVKTRTETKSKRGNSNVNPGGYAEFNDYDIEWTSPDGTLLPDSPLGKVNQQVIKLSEKAGREPSPGPLLEGWMKDAGFVDVVAEKIPMPVGTWAVDKRLVSTPISTRREPSHVFLFGRMAPALESANQAIVYRRK